MRKNRFEDFWKSANDGASTPVGPMSALHDDETSDLFDAWILERQNSVEFAILLKEAREMIARLLAEQSGSDARRRKARRLMQIIDLTLRASQAKGG